MAADRYVLGYLHQRTLRTGMRASVTFTPTLALQAYAQPFASIGYFTGVSQVADPGARQSSRRVTAIPGAQMERSAERVSFDLDGNGSQDLTIPAPDFTVLSFRSTFVLRWEYRSASTAALVVQHDRKDALHVGPEDPFDALARLGTAQATTQVMLKVSYWLAW